VVVEVHAVVREVCRSEVIEQGDERGAASFSNLSGEIGATSGLGVRTGRRKGRFDDGRWSNHE